VDQSTSPQPPRLTDAITGANTTIGITTMPGARRGAATLVEVDPVTGDVLRLEHITYADTTDNRLTGCFRGMRRSNAYDWPAGTTIAFDETVTATPRAHV
jgi:hypothetical protein